MEKCDKIPQNEAIFVIKELSCKYIYDDFVYKMALTDDERRVLDMLLKKYSMVKIAQCINVSDRNASRIIRDLKDKYNIFREIEVAKLKTFMTTNG